MQPEERRPQVTLTASSAPRVQDELSRPESTPRRGLSRWLLVLLPVLLLVVVLLGEEPEQAEPPVAADVDLVLLADRLSVTQSGVLVVTVQLTNRGEALQVRRADAYASPVVEDPVLQAPEEVAAGQQRRFVALVAPDCRLLRPGSGLDFTASLLLRVGRGSVDHDVVLDVATDPVVRERVAGLCA